MEGAALLALLAPLALAAHLPLALALTRPPRLSLLALGRLPLLRAIPIALVALHVTLQASLPLLCRGAQVQIRTTECPSCLWTRDDLSHMPLVWPRRPLSK